MGQPWICRPARVWLHVDPPVLGAQVEGLQGAGLAQQLDAVRVLIAAVVARAGLPLRVLVREARSQSLDDRLAGEVLAGNELNALPAMCQQTRASLLAVFQTECHGGPASQDSTATSRTLKAQRLTMNNDSPLPLLLVLDDRKHLRVCLRQGAEALRKDCCEVLLRTHGFNTAS